MGRSLPVNCYRCWSAFSLNRTSRINIPPTVLNRQQTWMRSDYGVQASSSQLAASLRSVPKEVDHPPVSMFSLDAKPVGVMGACAHGNPALKKITASQCPIMRR